MALIHQAAQAFFPIWSARREGPKEADRKWSGMWIGGRFSKSPPGYLHDIAGSAFIVWRETDQGRLIVIHQGSPTSRYVLLQTVHFAAMTVLLLLAGCGQTPDLPAGDDVTLPGGKTAFAVLGSGANNLANTEWACYRASDNSFLVNVAFGPNGEFARVSQNAAYFPEILGSELIADGAIHPAAMPGMTYAGGSFGASSGKEFGFSGPLNVWLAGLKVGTGRAYAYGTVDGDSAFGMFGYETQILGEDSPFGSSDQDEYEFYGVRIR